MRRRVAGAAALAAIALLAGACAPPHMHPMTYHNGSPWAEASINGQRGMFLVDTGASVTVVDVAFAERALLQAEMNRDVLGTGGQLSAAITVADRVEFAGRRHAQRQVAVLDLTGFVAPGGRQQDGLVGTDFLGGYNLVFDMERPGVALRNAPAPIGHGMEPHRMMLDGGAPMLDVWFPGELAPRWVRLDTGSSFARESSVYLDMGLPLANRLLGMRVNTPPDYQLEVVSITGIETLDVYTVEGIRVLGRPLPEVRVVVRREPTGAFAQADFMLVSGSLLWQFDRVEIDFPRRTLWVRPKESGQ